MIKVLTKHQQTVQMVEVLYQYVSISQQSTWYQQRCTLHVLNDHQMSHFHRQGRITMHLPFQVSLQEHHHYCHYYQSIFQIEYFHHFQRHLNTVITQLMFVLLYQHLLLQLPYQHQNVVLILDLFHNELQQEIQSIEHVQQGLIFHLSQY